ncbi:hypothetical protein ACTWPT_47070 [Nonomuraea sp. 3N208]|uniref:hypothetical protein n=1 Tax=Nonomuraea sp. 3N208 TaxID=3457421 RepID=UPI003FD4597D
MAAVSILGLTALSSAPANAAAAAGCTLTIEPVVGASTYRVTVGCTDGNVTTFKLYGSDWGPDDFIIHIWGSSSEILGDHLNEDIGARDEIYAKAYFKTPAGATGTRNTNRVDGYFGCVIDPVC